MKRFEGHNFKELLKKIESRKDCTITKSSTRLIPLRFRRTPNSNGEPCTIKLKRWTSIKNKNAFILYVYAGARMIRFF